MGKAKTRINARDVYSWQGIPTSFMAQSRHHPWAAFHLEEGTVRWKGRYIERVWVRWEYGAYRSIVPALRRFLLTIADRGGRLHNFITGEALGFTPGGRLIRLAPPNGWKFAEDWEATAHGVVGHT